MKKFRSFKYDYFSSRNNYCLSLYDANNEKALFIAMDINYDDFDFLDSRTQTAIWREATIFKRKQLNSYNEKELNLLYAAIMMQSN